MMAPVILIAVLFLAAAACVVAGVYLLAGLGWALIAAGAAMFGATAILRAGLRADG